MHPNAMQRNKYGSRLLTKRVDEKAINEPEQIFCSYPRANNLNDLVDVRYRDFARATNHVAHWLDLKLGKYTKTFAYIGPSDVRYFILVIASSKTGRQILLPSPRNSVAGQLSLLDGTKCTTILHDWSNNVNSLANERDLHILKVPSLEEILSSDDLSVYPYDKTFDEGKTDPYVILHTSGSTGLPKPISLLQGAAATFDAHHNLPDYRGNRVLLKYLEGKRILCTLPPFHGAGISIGLIGALFFDISTIWAPSNQPLNSSLIQKVLDSAHPHVAFLAPSMLEEIGVSEGGISRLSKLEAVCYGGGPLSPGIGNKIAKVTHLVNALGTTEVGMMPFYVHAKDSWEYFQYDPQMKGIEFREREEGVYELFLVRHPSTDPYHCAWWTFPNSEEYSTKDLYTKHPVKPDMWLNIGRADDIIVFSNGEKLNPSSMELILEEEPKIKGVLIIGQSRFEPAILIELRDDIAADFDPKIEQIKKQMIDSIWWVVEKANRNAPGHAKLSKDKIIFTVPEKPMSRAGKDTIQRQATLKLYSTEIENIYHNRDIDQTANDVKIELNEDAEKLQSAISNAVEKILGCDTINPDKEFFASGMDSLSVMRLTRQLKASAVLSGDATLIRSKIDSQMIYSNPTVNRLTYAMKAITISTSESTSKDEDRECAMKEMLNKYTKNLPQPHAAEPHFEGDGRITVLLTGSTGSLGTYILHALLSNDRVEKVFCLNRSIDGENRQKKINKDRGLIFEWGHRALFFQTNLARKKFGLDDEVYERLRQETSFVIHNQWQVNFNLSLESFEPHVEGTRHLIDFSAASAQHAPIFFISSVGAVGEWRLKNGDILVPEESIDDFSVPGYSGYSESKYITERLLEVAGKQSGVCSAICRVGQIAGPVCFAESRMGMWNKQEWLPSIIASSKFLGAIPNSLGGSQDEISWVPVNMLANIIVDLVLNDCSASRDGWTRYYHTINPRTCKWSDLLPAIMDHFQKSASFQGTTGRNYNIEVNGHPMKVVSFGAWVKLLEESSQRPLSEVAYNPGLKLLSFYQSMTQGSASARLDTKNTSKVSKTMRTLQPVSPEWMRLWLDQWQF
ncbi:MAG: hypothetical protein FE78DRAFT_87403 [Acidomyces sp. 'richmondensis']|nr:MAG: hypothetical protein FE78DRAFT_87403 [Acidomyces sp. 'richmondensis']